MSEYDFTGTHVLCDVTGIAPDRIADNALILDAIRRGIEESGAELCGVQTKNFEPSGVTAVYVLSESHVSVHTYPESGSLFMDAFTCGTRCEPQRIVEVLLDALGPCEYRTSVVSRGRPVRSLVPAVG
ncbi:S-adenosylmethionine decarboxylase proenzyme [Actinoplanes lutulentus]|uniref:adenosylmethionine decarboxylase n=1 Tax=Actinoplanes lutulentus TaxID=1287878 RepID=UPI0015EB9175|nr:adenosylmethionine decarboxylase [Actinoplanes lutulentus]MBB2942690.1 S-adenosylmethionine decarboxylase proenzyme [Actinoplanes lutulentus]